MKVTAELVNAYDLGKRIAQEFGWEEYDLTTMMFDPDEMPPGMTPDYAAIEVKPFDNPDWENLDLLRSMEADPTNPYIVRWDAVLALMVHRGQLDPGWYILDLQP